MLRRPLDVELAHPPAGVEPRRRRCAQRPSTSCARRRYPVSSLSPWTVLSATATSLYHVSRKRRVLTGILPAMSAPCCFPLRQKHLSRGLRVRLPVTGRRTSRESWCPTHFHGLYVVWLVRVPLVHMGVELRQRNVHPVTMSAPVRDRDTLARCPVVVPCARSVQPRAQALSYSRSGLGW